MSANKKRALQVLEQHELDVELIRLLLSRAPEQTLKLMNVEENEEWTFTSRRRCHLFIMAKDKYMKQYEVIGSTSG